MCIAGQIRYSCDHLGRKLGHESCVWFRLADTSIKLGSPLDDAKVVLNQQRCAREAATKYLGKERKCRACMKGDRAKEQKTESDKDEGENGVRDGEKREDS